MYFWNPVVSVDNRVCVKVCPVYEEATLKPVNCYGSIDCTYDYIIG